MFYCQYTAITDHVLSIDAAYVDFNTFDQKAEHPKKAHNVCFDFSIKNAKYNTNNNKTKDRLKVNY